MVLSSYINRTCQNTILLVRYHIRANNYKFRILKKIDQLEPDQFFSVAGEMVLSQITPIEVTRLCITADQVPQR